uniref:Glutathione S-transferase n=1 Tax=Kalanchoe fedtschenkoi TaxID=63787 RepID=A0A7N0ZWT0_KALFE
MAASGDVKLIGAWASPYVLRPRIALNMKSVEYEFLEEKFGQKSELLLKSNPVHKKIPVLIHGDRPVCESLIIVQYIDEAWAGGKPILPADAYDRATARFWAAYVDDKFFPSLSGFGKVQGEEAKKEMLSQVYDSLALLEGAYQTISKEKPFFGGDQIGYLDIALGSFLGWLRVTEAMSQIKLITDEKTPGLAEWAERFVADEAVKDVMPETEKLIEFAKIIFAKMKPAA